MSRRRMSKRAEAALADLVPGKFCYTCGTQKNKSDFNPKSGEYDGLQAECKRCQEYRELARKMDGAVGPRSYLIDGEGRIAPPAPSIDLAMRNRALSSALRARPTSGPVEVWV